MILHDWFVNSFFFFDCRKQCINETEQFDFLKDIVANIDDSASSSSVNEDVSEKIAESKELSPTESLDRVSVNVEEISKPHSQKCSISTMLNEDLVNSPLNQNNSIELSEDQEIINNNDNNVKD